MDLNVSKGASGGPILLVKSQRVIAYQTEGTFEFDSSQQTSYAIAILIWRGCRDLSVIQRPDFGFKCSVCVSSRPSLPLCHGYMAPSYPACFANHRASGRRQCRYMSNERVMSGIRRLRNGNMKSSSQKMCPWYASPCKPRAGTPASLSMVFVDTVCSK